MITDCLWSQHTPVGLFKCLKDCHKEWLKCNTRSAEKQILFSSGSIWHILFIRDKQRLFGGKRKSTQSVVGEPPPIHPNNTEKPSSVPPPSLAWKKKNKSIHHLPPFISIVYGRRTSLRANNMRWCGQVPRARPLFR